MRPSRIYLVLQPESYQNRDLTQVPVLRYPQENNRVVYLGELTPQELADVRSLLQRNYLAKYPEGSPGHAMATALAAALDQLHPQLCA